MTAGKIDALRVEDRIRLLEDFLAALGEWSKPPPSTNLEDVRRRLNRMVVAVRQALLDVQVVAKALVGNIEVDILANLFHKIGDQRVIWWAGDSVQQAIGVYESLRRDDGLVRIETPQAIDVLTAIERALRPAFDAAPKREREVQDEIETILRAVGANYQREVEAAPVGPTHFKPDFTVEAESLAIEVKLANDNHGAAAVQRELVEDVAAYGTKWKSIFFIVYDCGAIQDPEQFRRENQKLFGARVLIVKH